jgi:hypothetical protein
MSTLALRAGFSTGQILAKKFVGDGGESGISVLVGGYVQILPRGSTYSTPYPPAVHIRKVEWTVTSQVHKET